MKLFKSLKNALCQQRMFAAATALALSVLAAPATAAGMQAHAHGVAQLTIAMQGDIMEVALVSPAANIVGFEHKANNAHENAVVAKVQSQLEQPSLTFIGGDCDLHKTIVDIDEVSPPHSDHSHEHHERAQKHAQEHAELDNHSEISAQYHYRCTANERPSKLIVGLFNTFEGIERIDAMWIQPAAQGSATLTPKNTTIEFK
ncbi:ZrgA family zinc uptake protein [Gilvimarinus polysaccharolyticus]|uniref:ZrgA family zinc uptake protein n=1 Tax=Gilvimarinus polysaccharolyticus TaxID=863921 RepID=UPI000673AF0B|nr:DUF2796 domain-containing protein [Gilvimarinus polysaccharolyticus]